jgi:hypothetical protein
VPQRQEWEVASRALATPLVPAAQTQVGDLVQLDRSGLQRLAKSEPAVRPLMLESEHAQRFLAQSDRLALASLFLFPAQVDPQIRAVQGDLRCPPIDQRKAFLPLFGLGTRIFPPRQEFPRSHMYRHYAPRR